jgi:RNA polymerase sigma-70 factor (ECF subfamily)
MANGDAGAQSTFGKSASHAAENAGTFSTTHWSVVVEAAGNDPTSSAKALEQLCRVYWYPLYAFVRRRGCTPEEAEDLTQGFFAHLLQKEALKTVSREKGRFRSFLLTAFSNYTNNESEKQRISSDCSGLTDYAQLGERMLMARTPRRQLQFRGAPGRHLPHRL